MHELCCWPAFTAQYQSKETSMMKWERNKWKTGCKNDKGEGGGHKEFWVL